MNSSYNLLIDSQENDSLVEFNSNDIILPDESKTWDDFIIGQGGFSKVYKVIIPVFGDNNAVPFKRAAFKKIKYDKLNKEKKVRQVGLKMLKREANIVHQISHLNIIELYGVCYDDHFFGLLLELCEGGSLGNVCRNIKKQDTIALRILANWAHQISSAMKYLTDRNYIHRDLKADNVLVKELACFCSESETTPLDWCQICERRPLNKLQLKITDFGLSKTTMSVGHSVVGSLVWLAPEVFRQEKGDSNWSEFSDVWSFGVVLWEILAREMPHVGVYPIIVAHWNQEGQTLRLKESWPQKWKDIMEDCWSLDPSKRPNFESLVQYFEEYTKGLVEVHISDLQKVRNSDSTTQERFCCFQYRNVNTNSAYSVLNEHSGSSSSKFLLLMLFTELLLNQADSIYLGNPFFWRICWLIVFSILFSNIIVALVVSVMFSLPQSIPSDSGTTSSFNFIRPSDESIRLCGDNYTYSRLTGYCYKAVARRETHQKAELHCQADGGHLASIHSKEENDLVSHLYYRALVEHHINVDLSEKVASVWIGLKYDPNETKFEWNDGTPLDFQYWLYNKEPIAHGWAVCCEAWIIHDRFDQDDGKHWYNIRGDDDRAAYVCKKKARNSLN